MRLVELSCSSEMFGERIGDEPFIGDLLQPGLAHTRQWMRRMHGDTDGVTVKFLKHESGQDFRRHLNQQGDVQLARARDELEQLQGRLEGAAQESVQKEVNYLQSQRERMDYGTAKAKGEPLGSEAMESTCRQDQVRFKRTGQFWSQEGDEALMCLETFRRNGRWHLLFPHAQEPDLSKN